MMAEAQKSIVDQVHEAYPNLSERERLVADFVLSAPGEISVYGASELAGLVGVSPSTVTRFVQRTDFETYEEMRRSAREARSWGSPLFTTEHSASTSTKGFFDHEIAMLQSMQEIIDPVQIEEMASALCGARNLGFLGYRNSYYFAAYAHWQFIQFRAATRLIPGAGETVAERIADLGPGDVVVAVAVRRIVGMMKRCLDAVAETGADLLLITDPSVRSIPATARWTVSCPIETPHTFDSYTSVLAVLRLLAYETFREAGNAGRAHMHRVETWHDELAEFE